MKALQTLTIEHFGAVCCVTLSRPGFSNALNLQMFRDLETLCTALETDASVRAVLIKGDSRVYAAGADLAEVVSMSAQDADEHWAMGARLFERISCLPQVVVAAVAGYALGGGLLLALACDVRIGATNAKMGLPEIKLGLFPGMAATVRLSHLMGPSAARALCLTGEVIDAQRAFNLGVLHQITTPELIDEVAQELAQRLAGYSRAAMRGAKTALHAALELNVIEARNEERRAYREVFAHPDAKEGITAFLEKRAPSFNRMD